MKLLYKDDDFIINISNDREMLSLWEYGEEHDRRIGWSLVMCEYASAIGFYRMFKVMGLL